MCMDRARRRIDHPYLARAGREVLGDLGLDINEAVRWRDDLHGEIRREWPIRGRDAGVGDAVRGDEGGVRRADDVRSRRRMNPVSAPQQTPRPRVLTCSWRREPIQAVTTPCAAPVGVLRMISPSTSSRRHSSSGSAKSSSAVTARWAGTGIALLPRTPDLALRLRRAVQRRTGPRVAPRRQQNNTLSPRGPGHWRRRTGSESVLPVVDDGLREGVPSSGDGIDIPG